MIKVSKLGAAALAIALSVAFATPATASAAGYPVVAITQEQVENGQTYGDGTITTDEKIIYQTTDYEAYRTERAKYSNRDDISFTSRTISGKTNYYIIQRTYKNEITGATGDKKTVAPEVKATDDWFLTKQVYVNAGEPTYLRVNLINGDTSIKGVKSSKKGVLTAEIDKKNSSVSISEFGASYKTDAAGNYYYLSTTGVKTMLPKDKWGYCDTDSAEYKATNGSRASIMIKVNPKKAGTSKVSFKIYNKDGKQTGKASVKVVVRSDSDVFKTLTFGGKSLIQKKYGDTNYINYGRRHGSYDENVSNKTKGKLVVKANKGYKVVKIQVGTIKKAQKYDGYFYDKYSNSFYNEDSEYYSYSESGKYSGLPGVDLNGDGDVLDTVYGIEEANCSMNFKTVKSGKTIALGKYGYAGSAEQTYVSKSKSGNKTRKTTEKVQSAFAPTTILITYYNQETKAYRTVSYTVWRTAAGSKK